MYILHTYHRYMPEIARKKHLEDAISKTMDLFSSNCYEYQPWTLGQLYHPKSTPYYFTLSYFFSYSCMCIIYIYIYINKSIIFKQTHLVRNNKSLSAWQFGTLRFLDHFPIFSKVSRFPMTFPSNFGSVYPNPAGHWPTLHPLGPVPRSQKLPRNYSDDCGPHVATARCPIKSWENHGTSPN